MTTIPYCIITRIDPLGRKQALSSERPEQWISLTSPNLLRQVEFLVDAAEALAVIDRLDEPGIYQIENVIVKNY